MFQRNVSVLPLLLMSCLLTAPALAGPWLDGPGQVVTPARVGIGIASPSANLHTTGQNGVVFAGNFNQAAPTPLPVSGEGTRLMWLPERSALRAGTVAGTQWDAANIGPYSVATGWNTVASGQYAIAMGRSTTASGQYATATGFNATASGANSTAMGNGVTASGWYATAMGNITTASGANSSAFGFSTAASGYYSVAMGFSSKASGSSSTAFGYNTTASGLSSAAFGYSTTASGYYATALGNNTTAPSYAETAVGQNNTAYTPQSVTAWHVSDRLFVIGNGKSPEAKSDALVVLKNGNVGIGVSNPSIYKLQVNGIAAGTSWTNLSSREYKQQIRHLSAGEAREMLARLLKMEPAHYVYKPGQGGDGSRMLGFIAEEMPQDVLSSDGKGVDVYKLLTYAIAAMQAMSMQKDDEIAALRQELADQRQTLAAVKAEQADKMAALAAKVEMLTRAVAAGHVASR